jgi:hypothetical protein
MTFSGRLIGIDEMKPNVYHGLPWSVGFLTEGWAQQQVVWNCEGFSVICSREIIGTMCAPTELTGKA